MLEFRQQSYFACALKPAGVLMPDQHYTYYRDIFQGQPMPFAFLDLDLLNQNIHEITARCGDKHIRLASKSLRSVAVLKHILAADSRIQGIMCFSAREAVYLAEQGFDDLLIGYPTWHQNDLAIAARVVAAGKRITLMIDSLEHVKQAEAVARQYGTRLPLCLDVDMSSDFPGLHFGAWRSPIRSPEQARPVVECMLKSPHVYLDGLMGYEAQIAGVGDNVPGQVAKNILIRWLKQRSISEIAERRAAFLKLLASYELPLRFVNGGGTGSMVSTCTEPVVTEVTVGSGFYSPTLFDHFRDFRYQPSIGYAIEIVRCPQPQIYTCHGGGYIASGAVGVDKQPQPYLPAGAQLTELEGAGEVQTPIRYKGPIPLNPGDPIFMRHAKAGELCEHFNHLLLVRNGALVDKVTTYRGDGQCFL
ncbi:MAG: amino acid deaminase/aldolase [Ktedonobacteraceae bacterium]|nr:amino acid deaminase/aldolase [Ktedonobacteraceae bacterium]